MDNDIVRRAPLFTALDDEAAASLMESMVEVTLGRGEQLFAESERGDRLYLDVQRNGYAQMAVAPFSVRARPGAPVAAPLHWAEVEDAQLNPRWFTMRTIGDRLANTPDPWAGMSRHRHGLTAARRRLQSVAS